LKKGLKEQDLNKSHSRQRSQRKSDKELFTTAKPQYLFLDANLGNGKTERLTIYKGDEPEEVARSF